MGSQISHLLFRRPGRLGRAGSASSIRIAQGVGLGSRDGGFGRPRGRVVEFNTGLVGGFGGFTFDVERDDGLTDGNHLALFDEDLADDAIDGCGPLDDGLVRLDLPDRLVLNDRIADLNQPGNDLGLGQPINLCQGV